MQHIEEAGIHSGDSACVIPAHSLPEVVSEEIRRQTRAMACELKVKGLMNVQFAVGRDGSIYVLEVNPRASRTVPFVSKAIGIPLARHAALAMAGRTLLEMKLTREIVPKHYSVKESVFPFNKFHGVDIILGPEMRSTGEVMGIDDSFPMAFAKSQMAANSALPRSGSIFVSVSDRDKLEIVPVARALTNLNYRLLSTAGTAQMLRNHGIPVEAVPKLQEGRPNVIDLMKNGQVSLVINTPSGKAPRTDEGRIRAAAVAHGVTCITTLAAAQAAVEACKALREAPITVMALQDRYPPPEESLSGP